MSHTLDLQTNRDLYLFITRLREPRIERSLEDYLKALWRLGAAGRDREAWPLPAFAGLLEAAIHEPPPPYEPSWAEAYDCDEEARAGFARWEVTIRAQIVDLHEMEQAGRLADEQRYFGINAPRGARWYNFDPATYLECAACGQLGGWREGDAGDRAYVPGPCAVIGEDGSLTVADPRELPDPLVAVPAISWEKFTGFLRCGQYYE